MIIYIDDTGDPGFKLNKGSSDYFAIAAVCFANHSDEELMIKKLQELKTLLGWQKRREFKFRKANSELKATFFNYIKTTNFCAYVTIVNKQSITDRNLQQNASLFYNSIILQTLQSIPNLTNLHVYIDGEGGCEYRRKVKTFFRKNLTQYSLVELKYFDSKNSELIQLADMIVGLTTSYHTNKREETSYNLIKKHIKIHRS